MRTPSLCLRRAAFSLVEMLVVLSIIAMLTAVIVPAYATARGAARQTACASNLRQIGLGMAMYNQDYDGLYPYAVDPVDLYFPEIWDNYPDFQAQIPRLPMLHRVLQPYTESSEVFRCPADTGFEYDSFAERPLKAWPTSYEKYGTSYYYQTELTILSFRDSSLPFPSQTHLLIDGAGQWHGTLTPLEPRYNILFADGHVKNKSIRWLSKAGISR